MSKKPAIVPTQRASSWSDFAGPTLTDHACWSYASDEERAALVTNWLADGLRIGQRALFVTDGAVELLVGELAGLPDAAAALDSGALVVQSSTQMYDLSVPIDPAAQLAAYDDAVQAAVADGYQGLRVAADITPLVLDPARRDSHLRWEQFADRYIAAHPLAPLCLYDRRRVNDLPAIECVHPLQGPSGPRFALYGLGPTSAALRGEVDTFDGETFSALLRALPDDDEVLDVSGLVFMDAGATSLLHDAVLDRAGVGKPLTVTGAHPMLRRVWSALGYDPALLESA